MTRIGHLFDQVVSLSNLEAAAHAAQSGKRYRRDVLRFNYRQESELRALRRQLLAGDWRPSPHRHFEIHEPKHRFISAAPYRDRVVHHALCRVIGPLVERQMIDSCWANRRGKGSHRAVLALQRLAGRYPFVLKVDIRQYFPSIDHAILKAQFRRRFKDQRLLAVMDAVVDNGQVPVPHRAYFPGDDLFTPWTRRQGLPIGNLTSQLWANTYLCSFDHFVKQELRAPAYLRFVDDFLLLHDDKHALAEWRTRIDEKLAEVRVMAHPYKTVIRRTHEGTPFLGYVVWQDRIRVRGETVRRFRRRRRRRGLCAVDERRSLDAWRGHVGLAGSFRRVTVR